jgi:hypothetical protein
MSAAELALRGVAYLAGLGATAAVLSPLVSGATDSFPISTYPMFARAPGQPTLFAVVATAADGVEQSLPPELVGSSEVLQAKVLIQRSVQRGPQAMAELCEATAARVAASDRTGGLRFVDIVRRRYDPVAYFVTSTEPIERERIFRCPIPTSALSRRPEGQRP